MRANIDGTQIEVFVDSSISRPESLSIDPYSGNLYWADSELDRCVCMCVCMYVCVFVRACAFLFLC